MNTIAERQEAIVAELQAVGGWRERYKRIIELGRDLSPFPEEHRTDRNKVKGCQSQVWLHAELVDGRVRLHGDSDAAIVKGLVSIVLKAFSDAPPQEIAATPASFVNQLGLSENLSQTRANGLAALIKQIKLYGVAFSALAKQ